MGGGSSTARSGNWILTGNDHINTDTLKAREDTIAKVGVAFSETVPPVERSTGQSAPNRLT